MFLIFHVGYWHHPSGWWQSPFYSFMVWQGWVGYAGDSIIYKRKNVLKSTFIAALHTN
jgi:hypothetical protein